MRDLIYYVFYRTSKFYKLWGEKNTYYISGKFLLFLAICSNILTFIGVLCIVLGTKYGINIIYGLCFLLSILSLFVLNEKKYKELEIKYKDEKNRIVKGWLVGSYIIGSVILYFVSLYVFDM